MAASTDRSSSCACPGPQSWPDSTAPGGGSSVDLPEEAAGRRWNAPGPATGGEVLMQPQSKRRPYGTGSLVTTTRSHGARVYYGKFREPSGRQIKRRIGLVRTPHEPDGLTKTQAEKRLRDLIENAEATAPIEHAR